MEKLDENFLALSDYHLYSGDIETPSQNCFAVSPSDAGGVTKGSRAARHY